MIGPLALQEGHVLLIDAFNDFANDAGYDPTHIETVNRSSREIGDRRMSRRRYPTYANRDAHASEGAMLFHPWF